MGPVDPRHGPQRVLPLSTALPRTTDAASLRLFPRAALLADPVTAARRLLGALLVREDDETPRIGRIVEVEAYAGPEDRASHARAGRTLRNAAMFGPPGCAYVYRVYGMHVCLNVVTGAAGSAAATLIRAIEPVAGVDAMRRARAEAAVSSRRAPDATRDATARARVHGEAPHAIASGPGRLGAAFGVGVTMSGMDLCAPAARLRLALPPAGGAVGADDEHLTWPIADDSVAAGPRVGVAYAGEPWASLPWRLAIADAAAVSRPRPSGSPPPIEGPG